jgi:integrase
LRLAEPWRSWWWPGARPEGRGRAVSEAARVWRWQAGGPGIRPGPVMLARGPPGADSPALFTSGRGTRMTTDALADVIMAIVKAAGLDDHVTSHVLRHTFGTELTRSGVDIVTVAELMGHASLETTPERPSAADMQRAVDLLSADG